METKEESCTYKIGCCRVDYTGEMKDGLPSGSGTSQGSNGNTFIGYHEEGVPSSGILSTTHGDICGMFYLRRNKDDPMEDRLCGNGKFTLTRDVIEEKKGTVFQGQYISNYFYGVKSEKEDDWKISNSIFDINGNIIYVIHNYHIYRGMVREGEANGSGRIESFTKGTRDLRLIYEGEFQKDRVHGFGRAFWFNKGNMVAEFIGLVDGTDQPIFNGKLSEGTLTYLHSDYPIKYVQYSSQKKTAIQMKNGDSYVGDCGEHNIVMGILTYHGKGLLIRNKVSYDGTFHKGHFVEGCITYPDGTSQRGKFVDSPSLNPQDPISTSKPLLNGINCSVFMNKKRIQEGEFERGKFVFGIKNIWEDSIPIMFSHPGGQLIPNNSLDMVAMEDKFNSMVNIITSLQESERKAHEETKQLRRRVEFLEEKIERLNISSLPMTQLVRRQSAPAKCKRNISQASGGFDLDLVSLDDL